MSKSKSKARGWLGRIKHDSHIFKEVPADLVTEAFCLEAVKRNGFALQYVPDEFKNAELYLKAVKNEGCLLRDVPEKLKTPELCLAAVEVDGRALEYVPDEVKTEELCAKVMVSLTQDEVEIVNALFGESSIHICPNIYNNGKYYRIKPDAKFNSKYIWCDDDSFAYHISRAEFTDNNAASSIECFTGWGSLAVIGYTAYFEKDDNKWRLVRKGNFRIS